MVGPAGLRGIQPPYTFGGTLFDPSTGRPAWTGPDGEGGFSTPQLYQLSYQMYDGRVAFYWPGEYISDANLVTLGIEQFLPGVTLPSYLYLFAKLSALGASTFQAQVALAIIRAESGDNWSAHNRNIPIEDSIGLAQINLIAHPQYTGTNLYNIDANLAAMRDVSSGFTDWTPWTTYNDGTYLQYLPAGALGPTTPPPQASGGTGAGGGGGGGSGPVRQLLDGLIDDILGGVSVFGWHPGNDLKGVFDPVADWIDSAVRTLYGAALDVYHWADQQIVALAHYAEGLITDAIKLVQEFAVFVVGLGETAWRDAIAAASDALTFGLRLVDQAWKDGVAAVDAAWRGGVAVVDAAWRAGVAAEHALWTGAVDAEHALWSAAVTAEHALWSAAVDAVQALDTFALGVEHGLWTAALDAEHTLWNDAVAGVDAAWKAFVSDIFDPLQTEFGKLFGDAFAVGSVAVSVVTQVIQWLEWLATQSFSDVVDLFDMASSLDMAATDAALRQILDIDGPMLRSLAGGLSANG